jgi:predicted acylesterase/phospholipase RssA
MGTVAMPKRRTGNRNKPIARAAAKAWVIKNAPVLSNLPRAKKKQPAPVKQIGPALALSGGAAHGDFEVGVVRYLYEHGLKPTIICGTSVGSINALKLAEGEPDGPAEPDADLHLPGLAGLIAIWQSLMVNGDMYTQSDRLTTIKNDLLGALIPKAAAGGLLGGSVLGPFGGLLGLIVGGSEGFSDVQDAIRRVMSIRSLANLNPLMKLMGQPSSFKRSLVTKSKIELRMVMTALEDGAARIVDQTGQLSERDGQPTLGPSKSPAAGKLRAQIDALRQRIAAIEHANFEGGDPDPTKHDVADLVDLRGELAQLQMQLRRLPGDPIEVELTEAALASSSLPVFFPPQELGDGRNYVDGGTRMVTPIETAWRTGASIVYAVVASQDAMAVGTDALLHVKLPSYAPPVNLVDIGLRAGADIEPSEINDSQLYPANGWPIPVIVFRPRFDIHDSLTIDPGLIDIRMDQGWMVADDVMQAWARDSEGYLALAKQIDDERSTTVIARFRHQIWKQEFAANGLQYKADGTGSPQPPVPLGIGKISQAPEAVATVKAMKAQLHQLVQARLAAGGNVPDGAERWWTDWERHSWEPLAPLFPLPELKVQATPSRNIPFGKPTTIELDATSKDGRPVTGNVLVNGTRIGPTGKKLRTTFVPNERERIDPVTHESVPELVPPRVVVTADGFASAIPSLQFAGA